MVTEEQIQNIKQRLDNIFSYLKIDDKIIELSELEMKTADPEFYTSTSIDTESIFKQIRSLKKYIDNYNVAMATLDELVCAYDLYKIEEIDENELDEYYITTLNSVENAELQKMLSNEGDSMGCLLSINAGAGGTEANDWANMLFRMYDMWAKNHGYKPVLMQSQDGDKVGIKSVTIEIAGENAYGLLKSENGVHRLVRVSPYNAQGKRMTSFASVFVTPLVDDSIDVEIDESKVSYDYFRCSGAGGQNVNKVSSGVRIHYLYTDEETGETEEILVANTETRDQPKNKERARQNLKSILYNKELQKRLKKKKEIEDSKMKIEWGAQIRSYVFDDKRVKDHRTNYEDKNVERVMNGNIDQFIKSYLLQN